MTDFTAAYEDLGGAQPVKEVVAAVLARESALVFATRARHYVALIPAEGAQVALYAERNLLSVALDPSAAALVAERAGVPYVKKTPQTWYVRPSAVQLQDDDVARFMVDAGVEALRWCRERYVADRASGGVSARPDPAVCLSCNMQLLPAGACGTEACET